MRKNTREALMTAAQDLFIRYGYRRTTVDDIAKEAGVGKGTVYLYFKGKEEVAIAVVDEANMAIQERIRALARKSGDPVERLRRMLVERVMIRFDRVQGYVDCVEDFMEKGRPAYMAWRRQAEEAETKIFRAVLDEGTASGAFRVDDADAVARAFLVATTPLMPFDLSRNDLAKRAEVEELANRIAGLLIHGVVAPRP